MAANATGDKGLSGGDKAGIALVVAIVALSVLIPALIALALFALVRDRITKREAAAIGGAGLFGLAIGGALSHGALIGQYTHWLGVLVTGHGSRWAIPWAPLSLLAAFFFGCCTLAYDTRFAAWGLRAVGRKDGISGAGDSIIPDARSLRKMRVTPPPVDSMVIHADNHSILADQNQPQTRAFPLGVGARSAPVVLAENEVNTHMMVFGATGAGKTTALETIAGGLLDLGWSGVIVDLKEDAKPGGLRDWCDTYAHRHAIPFQELRLSDPAPRFWFNPLEGIGPDEARDTILSLTDLQDAYWAAINLRTLGQTCTLFWAAHEVDPVQFPTPSMLDIGRFLESPSLPQASKRMRAVVLSALSGVYDKASFNILENPQTADSQAAGGFGARVTGVYNTQAGRTVLRAGEGRTPLDITQDGLTYIGLDSLGKADLTRMVSSAVLQRLSVYASQRTTGLAGGKSHQRPRFVLIDEAGWVDRMIVQNLLSRARTAGISIILATQGPKDWDSRGPGQTPGFEMLAQNCNVGIIMAQGEPANAEVCANYIGQQRKRTFSQSVRDGELLEAGTVSELRDYIVDPEELRRLTIGQAIVKVQKPATRVEWVSFLPRDPETVARRS